MRKILLLLFLCGSTTYLHAQKLERMYNKAKDLFFEEEFSLAMDAFNEVATSNANYKDVAYKLEICSLLAVDNYRHLDKLERFEDRMIRKDKFYFYWKGRIQMRIYHFHEAINSLNKFLESTAFKSREIEEEAREWIEEAEAHATVMDDPKNYEIHMLEDNVNTIYAELSPIFFPDKEELIFIGTKDNDDYYAYHTRHINNREWTGPTRIEALGRFKEANTTLELVYETKQLFQYKNKKGGDLYYSTPTDTEFGWTRPVEFDSRITATDLSSHFFINEHKDRIIFSRKVGNKKSPNLDLFESFKDVSTGKWTKPALFSTGLTGEDDEDSPYLSPDEQTLYFCSNRPGGLGGYDVYRSNYDSENQVWSEPENLGFPINTPGDELYFKLNPDQKSGYFVSNRVNGIGDFDIYFFWDLHEVKIEGRVMDLDLNEPITNAEIYFRPAEYLEMYFKSPIDSRGAFSTSISADQELVVEVIKDGKLVLKDQFEVHDTEGVATTYLKNFYKGTAGKEGDEDPALLTDDLTEPIVDINEEWTASKNETQQVKYFASKYRSSNKMVLRNIYFDPGQSRLKETSYETLNALYELMDRQLSFRIEVSGHTDNIGDAKTNMRISEQRAQSVKDWLIDRGISKSRVEVIGFGETRPMASNDQEKEGRELNRRIEIRIL